MTTTHVLAGIVIAALLRKSFRWLGDTAYVMAAMNHVRAQSDVDEGFMASMSNLGVLYSPTVVSRLDRIVMVHIHAAYKRGGYPEHDRFFLVQIDRASKTVCQCDTVDVASITE